MMWMDELAQSKRIIGNMASPCTFNQSKRYDRRSWQWRVYLGTWQHCKFNLTKNMNREWLTWFSHIGGNFINILRTNFSYQRRFGSFFYKHVTREKLPKQRSYEKSARKMLLKLTPWRRNWKVLDRTDEWSVSWK